MLSNAIRELLARAGIEIGGSQPWDIRVLDDRFHARVFRDRNLGLGESYMDGWWECERLDEMVFRLLRAGVEGEAGGRSRHFLRMLPAVLFNLQSRARARIVAKRHYDLGNDLFGSFLDPYRQYSCADFRDTGDLGEAQRSKMARIAEKLALAPGDRVLDVGCGWGGLARYLAERHGCEVTGVNVSREQLRYARDFCAGLPVTFLDRDYRSIEGKFDKVVSVGMFEHVGSKNYRTFMKVVRRCLEGSGAFFLQTIGRNTSGSGGLDPWMERYIFPNGMLPSVAQIARAAEGLFVIEEWSNLGPHYDRTLLAWNANFQAAWDRLRERYDARFKRMWEYYLLSCAGAFRARHIHLWQVRMIPDPAS